MRIVHGETCSRGDFTPGEEVSITWDDGIETIETIDCIGERCNRPSIVFAAGKWIGTPPAVDYYVDPDGGRWVCPAECRPTAIQSCWPTSYHAYIGLRKTIPQIGAKDIVAHLRSWVRSYGRITKVSSSGITFGVVFISFFSARRLIRRAVETREDIHLKDLIVVDYWEMEEEE